MFDGMPFESFFGYSCVGAIWARERPFPCVCLDVILECLFSNGAVRTVGARVRLFLSMSAHVIL